MPAPRSTTKQVRPGRGLGEHEEDVAHRRRAEPLVARDLVVPVADGLGARGVGAHVRAALLLGHRHPAERAALVVGQRQPRLPLRRQLGVAPQRRDRRVGHRDRAHDAGVGLRPQAHQRGAGDVGARARVAPRQRVDLALDRAAQQPVPGRVEVDVVDAVAVAVVGLQPRRVALGAAAVLLRLGRARHGARVTRAVDGPAAALALERLAQREVDVEEVGPLERGGLVDDLVRRRSGGACPPRRTLTGRDLEVAQCEGGDALERRAGDEAAVDLALGLVDHHGRRAASASWRARSRRRRRRTWSPSSRR